MEARQHVPLSFVLALFIRPPQPPSAWLLQNPSVNYGPECFLDKRCRRLGNKVGAAISSGRRDGSGGTDAGSHGVGLVPLRVERRPSAHGAARPVHRTLRQRLWLLKAAGSSAAMVRIDHGGGPAMSALSHDPRGVWSPDLGPTASLHATLALY